MLGASLKFNRKFIQYYSEKLSRRTFLSSMVLDIVLFLTVRACSFCLPEGTKLMLLPLEP